MSDDIVLLNKFVGREAETLPGAIYFVELRGCGFLLEIYVQTNINRIDLHYRAFKGGAAFCEIAFTFSECESDDRSLVFRGRDDGHLRLSKSPVGDYEVCVYNGNWETGSKEKSVPD